MATYYLAPSLRLLRSEVNTRWPGRDRTSDGWIGDTSHAARLSDHNPDWDSGGVVRALDIDVNGIDVEAVKAGAFRHPAVNYVLHNRQSFTRGNGFRPVPYRGVNPHTGHLHISIRHDRASEVTQVPWLAGVSTVADRTTGPTLSIPTPIGGTLGALTPEDDMTPDQEQDLKDAAQRSQRALEHAETAAARAQAALDALADITTTLGTITGYLFRGGVPEVEAQQADPKSLYGKVEQGRRFAEDAATRAQALLDRG